MALSAYRSVEFVSVCDRAEGLMHAIKLVLHEPITGDPIKEANNEHAAK